jgi:EAL domain-containing protein (putative c-di-GMP-specific phosphodiesterase class I)
LPDRVAQVLQQTGLSARCLKLEITESIVMEDAEATIDILLQMKALQVRLAIDDFGTGYSSLSYLHRFPNDTLKVDKSFVTRMQEGDDNAAIVRTIVSLAHILNMDTIAEGIETPAQLEKLRSLGCEYGQGYLFAKPLPSEEAETLLASNPKW